jgi:hypothetical protein
MSALAISGHRPRDDIGTKIVSVKYIVEGMSAEGGGHDLCCETRRGGYPARPALAEDYFRTLRWDRGYCGKIRQLHARDEASQQTSP